MFWFTTKHSYLDHFAGVCACVCCVWALSVGQDCCQNHSPPPPPLFLFIYYYFLIAETRRTCHGIPHRPLNPIVAGTGNSRELALNLHDSTNEPCHCYRVGHADRTVTCTRRRHQHLISQNTCMCVCLCLRRSVLITLTPALGAGTTVQGVELAL